MTPNQRKHDPVRVAVIQAAAVFMDRSGCLDKALKLIDAAAKAGAQLLLFPEAFIPGYPRGLNFGAAIGNRSEQGRELFARYHASAIEIPDETTEALAKAVRDTGVILAIGIVERDRQHPRGTLYCTLLFISEDGKILGKHRKLKPTASERIIWGEGYEMPQVYETSAGKIGGLICWENYMPEARMSLYRQGLELYLAPTADSRESWQATMRHIACEGRCFVLACNQYTTRGMYPEEIQKLPELQSAPEPFCRGGSAILDPFGNYLAGPLYDEEGILYADLDFEEVVKARYDLDIAGHYSRPDLFPPP